MLLLLNNLNLLWRLLLIQKLLILSLIILLLRILNLLLLKFLIRLVIHIAHLIRFSIIIFLKFTDLNKKFLIIL